MGYSIDICARIVDAVKARIKRDDIQVKYLPVTSATRDPLMGNGTIDLECAPRLPTRWTARSRWLSR